MKRNQTNPGRRSLVPAVCLLLALAVSAAPAAAQTRGRLGYDGDTDAGFLTVWGTNGERLGRLWVGANDAAGQFRIYDDGETRALLEADGASQGRLILYGSGGLQAARLTVLDGTDSGSLSIYDGAGGERALLEVDGLAQGRLTLYGSDGDGAARLTVTDAHDAGALWLYDAGGVKKADFSIDGSGQGLLILEGSDDAERVRLSLYDDDDSAYLRLKGAAGTTIVQADRSSTGAADNGRLRVYAGGDVRGELAADAATGGGKLVLRDSSGAVTITLDAETGNITKSGSNGFLVPHPEDSRREVFYTSLEGPEAAMYVRGTAELRGGRAQVELPRHFALLARDVGITVQLTPNSADTHGLAVVAKSARGIEVRELAGGSGDFAFDYVVFATRKDVAPIEVVRPRSWEAAGADPDLEALDKSPAEAEAPVGREAAERPDRRREEGSGGRPGERGGEPS